MPWTVGSATMPFVGRGGDRASAVRTTPPSSLRATAGFTAQARFVHMRRAALAVTVALALPGSAAADPLSHGLTQLQRDVRNDCRFVGACSGDVAAYERSDTHRTL